MTFCVLRIGILASTSYQICDFLEQNVATLKDFCNQEKIIFLNVLNLDHCGTVVVYIQTRLNSGQSKDKIVFFIRRDAHLMGNCFGRLAYNDFMPVQMCFDLIETPLFPRVG